MLSDDAGHREGSHGTLGAFGLGSLVVSTIMLPVGWTMFVHNRKPRIEFTPYGVGERRQAEGELRFGVKAVPSGAGLAAALAF